MDTTKVDAPAAKVAGPKNTLRRNEIAEVLHRSEKDHVLVVVDGSQASARGLRYIAEVMAGLPSFEVCLAYPMPDIPPEYYELESREKDQAKWKADAKLEAKERFLNYAVEYLQAAGVPHEAIGIEFFEAGSSKFTANEVLDLAKQHNCAAIAVALDARPWWHSLLGTGMVQQIARQSEGLTPWMGAGCSGKNVPVWLVQNASDESKPEEEWTAVQEFVAGN